VVRSVGYEAIVLALDMHEGHILWCIWCNVTTKYRAFLSLIQRLSGRRLLINVSVRGINSLSVADVINFALRKTEESEKWSLISQGTRLFAPCTATNDQLESKLN
jgi:hypothetical protein